MRWLGTKLQKKGNNPSLSFERFCFLKAKINGSLIVDQAKRLVENFFNVKKMLYKIILLKKQASPS